MRHATLRRTPISSGEILIAAIAVLVIAGIGSTIIFPQREPLKPLNTAWGNLAQQLERNKSSINQDSSGIRIPGVGVTLPSLPSVSLPNIPNISPLPWPSAPESHQELVWTIQQEPCPTAAQSGSNWDGRDGMWHCATYQTKTQP